MCAHLCGVFQLPKLRCDVMYNRNVSVSPYNFTRTHTWFSVYNFPPHLFALNRIISSFIPNPAGLHDVFKGVTPAVLSQVNRGGLEMVLRETSWLHNNRSYTSFWYGRASLSLRDKPALPLRETAAGWMPPAPYLKGQSSVLSFRFKDILMLCL